jgi:hypothetical protein
MTLVTENRHNAAYVDLSILSYRFDTYYIVNVPACPLRNPSFSYALLGLRPSSADPDQWFDSRSAGDHLASSHFRRCTSGPHGPAMIGLALPVRMAIE